MGFKFKNSNCNLKVNFQHLLSKSLNFESNYAQGSKHRDIMVILSLYVI